MCIKVSHPSATIRRAFIDGMAAVQSLGNTTGAKSFGEWSDNFTAFVVVHFSDKCTRVYVVFDQYLTNSLKGSELPEKSGREERAKVITEL